MADCEENSRGLKPEGEEISGGEVRVMEETQNAILEMIQAGFLDPEIGLDLFAAAADPEVLRKLRELQKRTEKNK